jgi:hypothetical protein
LLLAKISLRDCSRDAQAKSRKEKNSLERKRRKKKKLFSDECCCSSNALVVVWAGYYLFSLLDCACRCRTNLGPFGKCAEKETRSGTTSSP